MEDRCVNSGDKSFEDGLSIATKAFPCIPLIVHGHLYWFNWFYCGRGLGSAGRLKMIYD